MNDRKDPFEDPKIPRRLRTASESPVINKWVYSILAGLICLAFAETPGGLSGLQAFAIAFVTTFLAIMLLELLASRSSRHEEKSHD
jgi:uncharacterized membrane protein YjjP (DUF1212 family)